MKIIFPFSLLGLLGLFLIVTGYLILFERRYQNRVYPDVTIAVFSVGGKNKEEIKSFFEEKNQQFNGLTFTFIYQGKIATVSGSSLKVGYDSKLLSEQAYLVGRSGNVFTSLVQKFSQTNLAPSFTYNQPELDNFLENFALKIDVAAQEPLFNFSGNRITAFRLARPGQAVNREKAEKDFLSFLSPPRNAVIKIELDIVPTKVKTEEANNLGIRELLGEGKSFFQGSISNRIYNLTLAASRLNGLLIASGEVFSFNQALGEVSAATGYKPAYVIKEKKTVLDDGGGVCQVSTTLFRAALAAGLPIEERQAHAYRVSYYEQGGFGPGLDATVYSPTVDLKIKNDTPAYVLIQTEIDQKNLGLTIGLYGAADGRAATIGKPEVWEQTPPPPDLYQDDPNLPKGEIKQVDFPAWGAKTSFDYQVLKNGGLLEKKTFYSNFQPWQAVFLKGTKE